MEFPINHCTNQVGHRLINSKFPPIGIFDEVAKPEQLTAVYALQELTNPRMIAGSGNYHLLPVNEVPLNIQGCHAASAPFFHINPRGSRFADGDVGMLYLAENIETAIAETKYHQATYLNSVEGVKFDVLTMREYKVSFSGGMHDLKNADQKLYDKSDYTYSRRIGASLRVDFEKDRAQGLTLKTPTGIEYYSVRNESNICWSLFTPKFVSAMLQHRHWEYIYDPSKKAITNVLQINEN